MRNIAMLIAGASMVLCLATSCGSKEGETAGETTEQTASATYECPMKCEGKTHTAPGQCSVCGMDLVKLEK